MASFIGGVIVASLFIRVLWGGRREPERVYVPVESRRNREDATEGWNWLGALPFLVILFVLYRALVGI